MSAPSAIDLSPVQGRNGKPERVHVAVRADAGIAEQVPGAPDPRRAPRGSCSSCPGSASADDMRRRSRKCRRRRSGRRTPRSFRAQPWPGRQSSSALLRATSSHCRRAKASLRSVMSDAAEPTLLYLPYERFLEEVETLAAAIEADPGSPISWSGSDAAGWCRRPISRTAQASQMLSVDHSSGEGGSATNCSTSSPRRSGMAATS